MASAKLYSAKTQYVAASNGVKFAYHRLGSSSGLPLVMHIHFRANMDFWDPSLIEPLAIKRPIVLFDQAGVGRSTGEVPTTFQGWADNVIALCEALALARIDLFGFSMGGMCVQMVALTRPGLVRKLILAGTTASGPDPQRSDVRGILWPRDTPPTGPIRLLATAETEGDIQRALAVSFFPDSEAGREAFGFYWERISQCWVQRSEDHGRLQFADKDVGGLRQRLASRDWTEANDPRNSFERLRDLEMPALVLNGDDDVLIPTSRSWELMKKIENAKLIIYPRAGHGFLWQYADEVARDIDWFLDSSGDGWQDGGSVDARL